MAKLAKNVASEHVNNFAIGGAGFALIPIPGIHSAGLTAAEAKLAADIAHIYGVEPKGAMWSFLLKIIMLKLGGSYLLKGLCEALTFTPVIKGQAVKAVIAASTIKAFGEAVINFFENKFPFQKAYQHPSLESMLVAFGESIAQHEIIHYYNHFLENDYNVTDEFSGDLNKSSADRYTDDMEKRMEIFEFYKDAKEAASEVKLQELKKLLEGRMNLDS